LARAKIWIELDRERLFQDLIAAREFEILKHLRPYCLYEVGSTQDYLSKVLKSRSQGDFVIARVQTSGRGRSGNSWYSDIGGLYLSLTLVPARSEILHKLTFALAESVVQALQEFGLGDCMIKAPNDVLCNRKKIAGVLADAELQQIPIVYCGIGVNLNNGDAWSADLISGATSYYRETRKKLSIEDFAMVLLKTIDANYSRLLKVQS
jgi:BirA family transcriptional regulator, biotin operon repressor / biotin---[acetyl-CoA-carboxylase] ligase